MTKFQNSLGTESRIEFEPSWRKGYIVLKMYNDRHVTGNCWEIPINAFEEIIKNGLEVLNVSK